MNYPQEKVYRLTVAVSFGSADANNLELIDELHLVAHDGELADRVEVKVRFER